MRSEQFTKQPGCLLALELLEKGLVSLADLTVVSDDDAAAADDLLALLRLAVLVGGEEADPLAKSGAGRDLNDVHLLDVAQSADELGIRLLLGVGGEDAKDTLATDE